MKFVAISFLAVLLCSPVVAQTPARNSSSGSAQPQLCSVSGFVMKLEGSDPLKNATVRLSSLENLARSATTVTDTGGRFELKGIVPGRYRLKVSRNGYVTQEYGQKTPNGPGTQISLAAGQDLRDLQFRLAPWGVIAGRVIDEDGDPIPWAQVSALREVYSHGKRGLTPEALVPTNDLGEYRLFGLRPGQYFISARFKPGSHVVGRDETQEDVDDDSHPEYMPIYYPSSPDPARASAITLRAGEEIPAVEILLRAVATFHVRGHVYNVVPGRRSSSGVILQLEPRGNNPAWDSVIRQFSIENADGTFDLDQVLPGPYTLSAFWFEDGRRYQARLPIEVGNADVEGANLIIAQGMNINGRIVWDGKPSMDGSEFLVNIAPVDSRTFFSLPARTIGNTFVLKDVFEGTYRLIVSGQSRDCYLKAVRHGASDALESGFTVIRGTQQYLEVTISSRGARVQGTVTDKDNQAVTGVWVVLVPDEKRREQSMLFQKTATDQYGRFLLRGIPPGDYKLFSWDEVEDGAWGDADFLRRFESFGQEVSVEEGDSKTADVTVIRTKTGER